MAEGTSGSAVGSGVWRPVSGGIVVLVAAPAFMAFSVGIGHNKHGSALVPKLPDAPKALES